MEIKSTEELVEYGRNLAGRLKLPAVIELVGDVGAGKTTLTRGIAEGLGVKEAVTSPSFTICKRYRFKLGEEAGTLVHYDFYRLAEPGIMRAELAESLQDDKVVVVVEWGESVADLLPAQRKTIEILVNDDGSRECLDKR